MALTIKFSITCCSWTRLPWTRGKPSANCVRTKTLLFTASVRARAITSRMASSIATASFRAGTFLMSERTRSTTSPARFPSLTIRESASSISRKFGGSALSQRRAANAYVTAAVIGWFTSWVIEAVNWPIVATRLAEARESERRYREAQLELEHANRVATMGQLTASITHEVNQPITAAVTYALAARRFLSAEPPNLREVDDALSLIVKEGNRAGEVVGRIRALIKKAPARKDAVAINDAILEVIALTRTEAANNSVSVRTQLADGLPSVP